MNPGLQRFFWIAWPAFLVAGLIELVVFAFIDPAELHAFGRGSLELSRQAVYTLAFLVFWALAALGGFLTVTLVRPPLEVNRCPLQPQDRPEGCPKRATGEG